MAKLALAQINIKAGHPADNLLTIKSAITKAKNESAELIIFPAFAISGKMAGNFTESPDFLAECQECAAEITAMADGIDILFGSVDGIFLARNGSCNKLTTDNEGNVKLTVNGQTIICHLTSEPYYLGKRSEISTVLTESAIKHSAPLFYVNNTGIQNNGKTVYLFEGDSAVFDKTGKKIFSAPSFADTISIIDFDNLSSATDIPQYPSLAAELFNAVKYGIQEFLASIGINKVVIGISGGIDSAVAAAMYGTVLSPQNIYLVNMPSRFNSETTKSLAKSLADNIGANYAVIPIEDSVNLTISQLNNTRFDCQNLTVKLDVSSFVTENIQARDRSARILAAVAACVGGVFSCNANKAETTIGYSTLYGDDAGFFAPLADLWKHQVYDLARYLNETVYHREVIPQGTIDIIPSAELSTAQDVNAGKGDPLIYPYHDYLFQAFTEYSPRITPGDLLDWYLSGTLARKIGCEAKLVKQLFPTAADFTADLERWWNLYCGIAVAKRIQAPPILAVSRKPFGTEYREAQNGVYYTKKYRALKNQLSL